MTSPRRLDPSSDIVLYIYGEYWGIHNIRERYDEHYLARVYGVDPDNLDIIESVSVVNEGDTEHFYALRNFIRYSDVALESNYEYVKTQMDIENFIDYQITEIYVCNTDWPGNNIKYWRLKTNSYQPDATYGHDVR